MCMNTDSSTEWHNCSSSSTCHQSSLDQVLCKWRCSALSSQPWLGRQSLLQTLGQTNRAGQGSLELTCLTICSWTLLLACRNACCSSLRKFSDFWHLAMSKEILKKENTDRLVRNKAWNRFWKRNKFPWLLLLIGTWKFQTKPLKLMLILHSAKQESSYRQ